MLQWYSVRLQNPSYSICIYKYQHSYHSRSGHRDYRDDPVFCCFVRAASDSHSHTWGFSDRNSGSCGSTSYRDTFWAIGSGHYRSFRVSTGRPSYQVYRADQYRFTYTSNDRAWVRSRGFDSLELRVRWWSDLVLVHSPCLSAQLVCPCPANWPLDFGAWRQRGRGSEYVRLRGSVWDGLILLCVTFMHIVFTFMLFDICGICVFVRLMWHVCSLLWFIYVISIGYAHLLCFRVLLRFKWALLHVLMLNSYLLSTPCHLGSYKHA